MRHYAEIQIVARPEAGGKRRAVTPAEGILISQIADLAVEKERALHIFCGEQTSLECSTIYIRRNWNGAGVYQITIHDPIDDPSDLDRDLDKITNEAVEFVTNAIYDLQQFLERHEIIIDLDVQAASVEIEDSDRDLAAEMRADEMPSVEHMRRADDEQRNAELRKVNQ